MAKPITETLSKLHDGMFLDNVSEEFARLVRGVDETGKAGKLTITVELKKSSGAMALNAKFDAKIPEPKPDSTLLWPTVEGNLVVDNPAQRKLAFAEVPKAPTAVVDVPARREIVDVISVGSGAATAAG